MSGSQTVVENGFHPETGYFKKGEMLKKVFDMTIREKLVTGIDESSKVVEFKHPEEMSKILKLKIEEDGATREEIESLLENVVRYSVKTMHPHFYNQQFGGIDEVGLAAAWLTESLNTNQHTYECTPVFILMEHFLIKKLLSMFGFPEGDGVFAAGGSMSNMYGIVLARHKKFPDIRTKGVSGMKPLVSLTSDQHHYCVKKGMAWLGLGSENAMTIATDEQGRMIPQALREAIKQVRDSGKEPFYVSASAGTTVLGAFDPFDEIADICQQEGLWMHVDACWGGSAIFSNKNKFLLKGSERADSLSWNAHKMTGAPLQCSPVITRHKGLIADCLSLQASYLFQQDKFYDISYDLGDFSIQCGRKVDAFKLYFMLNVHGLAEMEKKVDDAFDAAKYLDKQVRCHPGFKAVMQTPPMCNNICFWYIPPSLRGQTEDDAWWQKVSKVAPAIKAGMMLDGTLMVGYQPLDNKNYVNFFRMITTCIPTPTKEHMDFVINEIDRLGKDL